jgi:pimeloyl-ACP methyl ester carboxylesterase
MANDNDCRGVELLRNVNGCQIHYEVLENASSGGTPVLFLHGWGCDSGIFGDLMDAMRGGAALISLDFPGHGSSEEPPEPWGVKEFALQVKQVLENSQISKVNVVAHSFGARVAIYLAAQEPQMIEKLVITGGAGIKKPATKESRKRTARYKRLRTVACFLMKIPPLKGPMHKAQNRLIRKYGSDDYAKLSEGMRATFVKIVSEDLKPLLCRIAAPTLLIWGGNDRETPLWMGETMEREIRDAGLVVFEGRSHYAFLEESARFLLIVRRFFGGGDEK